jgi:hypothetical protein
MLTKHTGEHLMRVSPLNYCPASFAAVVHIKERLYVKDRNLSLYSGANIAFARVEPIGL